MAKGIRADCRDVGMTQISEQTGRRTDQPIAEDDLTDERVLDAFGLPLPRGGQWLFMADFLAPLDARNRVIVVLLGSGVIEKTEIASDASQRNTSTKADRNGSWRSL
ncbi:hypothetical protein ACIBI9_28960 [Nonomuraea sp. NPDC050451]|uniref:hypothetical protein n=1 Tax=Nonomuraea sp. NPDC050451 TaxID=3364364 RepID=UPI0037B93357